MNGQLRGLESGRHAGSCSSGLKLSVGLGRFAKQLEAQAKVARLFWESLGNPFVQSNRDSERRIIQKCTIQNVYGLLCL